MFKANTTLGHELTAKKRKTVASITSQEEALLYLQDLKRQEAIVNQCLFLQTTEKSQPKNPQDLSAQKKMDNYLTFKISS